MTQIHQADPAPLSQSQKADILLQRIDQLNRRVGTRLRLDTVMGTLVTSPAEFNNYIGLIRSGKLISRDGFVWVPHLDDFDYNRSCGYLDAVLKGWQDEGVSNDIEVFLTTDPGIFIPPEWAIRVLSEYRGITNEEMEYEFIESILPDVQQTTQLTREMISTAINAVFNYSVDITKAPFDRIVEKAMGQFKQHRSVQLEKRQTALQFELDGIRTELKELNA